MEGLVRCVHQPGPDFIGGIKHHRHSDRVADPYQANGKGQVDAEENGGAGSHDHLAGKRYERHKQTDRKCARRRTAVEAPQIWVVKHIAKYLQRFLALDDIVAWHYSFNYLSWHCNSIVHRQA